MSHFILPGLAVSVLSKTFKIFCKLNISTLEISVRAIGRHGSHSRRTHRLLWGDQGSPVVSCCRNQGDSRLVPYKFLVQVSAGYTALFIVDEKTT